MKNIYESIIKPIEGNNQFQYSRKAGTGELNYHSWFDQSGLICKYDEKFNNLIIRLPNDQFNESLIERLNSINDHINIILYFKNDGLNCIASINSALDAFKRIKSNKNVIFDITNVIIDSNARWDVKGLPSNIKLSNVMMARNESKPFYGTNAFDWWALNQDEDTYNEMLKHVTHKAKERMVAFRTVAKDFYESHIANYPRPLSDKEKMDMAFDWCRLHTSYDGKSTKSDGNLKDGCSVCSDPIATLKRRKGVCTGRSRLLKILTNNYYAKVPCIRICGTIVHQPEDLGHEWCELVTDQGSIYYDLSFDKKGVKLEELEGYYGLYYDAYEYIPNDNAPRRKPEVINEKTANTNRGTTRKRKRPKAVQHIESK
jgi:hypothetical protein